MSHASFYGMFGIMSYYIIASIAAVSIGWINRTIINKDSATFFI